MENTCRLCLNLTDGNVMDASAKLILDTLSLKIDFSDCKAEPRICRKCMHSLQKCFDLFNLCQNTKANGLLVPLHLREQNRDKSCLFCMKIVTMEVGNFLKQLREVMALEEPLAKCILDLYATACEEPVLCEICHDALETYMEFSNNCVAVQREIKTLDLDKLDVKQEACELLQNVLVVPKSEEYCGILSTVKEELFCGIEDDYYKPQMKTEDFPKIENMYLHTAIKLDDVNAESTAPKARPQPPFKCSVCPYETNASRNLKKHTAHWHSETPLSFKCEVCPFTTRHKHYLSTHALLHKEGPDVEIHKCPTCDYQTKKRCSIKRHLRNHDEKLQYRCDKCPYVTKHKICLKRHEIVHKSSSEITMYKCDFCSYESRYKKSVKVHLVTHKEATDMPMYKCDHCEYGCKLKSGLNAHKLVHKEMSQVKVLKCEFCSYTTKRRSNLAQHSVVHQKAAERKTFKCDICGYEAKWKTNLKQHIGVHRKR